jgi:hypothetical protein
MIVLRGATPTVTVAIIVAVAGHPHVDPRDSRCV